MAFALMKQAEYGAPRPPLTSAFASLLGGEVTHRIALERSAYACMIGEENLYILTSGASHPDKCRTLRDAAVQVYPAPYPAAGCP